MGCIVNGPGESKHANIGISLPGTGETPAAPVFIDGAEDADAARRAHRRGIPGDRRATTSSARRWLARTKRRRPSRLKHDDRTRPETSSKNRCGRQGHERHPAAGSRALWELFEDDRARRCCSATATSNIRTPIVEHTALFVRGIGEVTDIVEKEMYSFTDSMNGDQLDAAARRHRRHRARGDRAQPALRRPAAPVVRRARCSATSGRRSGRYRQFHQFGVEALGFAGPDVDAELILMCRACGDDLGLARQHVASSSTRSARPTSARRIAPALIALLRAARGRARRRCAAPPAHAIRCASSTARTRRCRTLVEAAPKLIDFLGDESLAHFDARAARCSTRPALAFTHQSAPGARPRLLQPAPCSSGSPTASARRARSAAAAATTALFEQLGGKPTPAVGFGHGHRAAAAAARGGRRGDAGARRPTPMRSCPAASALPAALARLRGAARRRRRRC